MNGKQHIVIFVLTALPLWAHNPQDPLHFVLGGLIGCLLPDTDTKESIGGHILPLWLIFGHGKQTHTILVNLIFVALYFYTKHDIFYGMAFGYFGHLIGDDMQGNNLKYLFYPIVRKSKNYNEQKSSGTLCAHKGKGVRK